MVGAGVFGRNHLRVLRALADEGAGVELTAVLDADPQAAARAAEEFRTSAVESLHELLAATSPDVAIIAVPTRDHAAVAAPLLRAGVHCLIEKPLAPSISEAQQMLEAARTSGALLQVGHLERFNPAVAAARAHLTRPMFFEAHRLSVFTPRSLDVDVVLDLMIHDLDIVLSLVNQPVREIRAVGLPVLSRRVDIANVRLEFEGGAVANFTASRVSTERVRKLRFFQPQQYLSLDFGRQDLLLIDVSAAAGALAGGGTAATEALSAKHAAALDPAEAPITPAGPHPSAGLELGKVEVKHGEPLRLELEAFLHAVRSGTPPGVSGEDGLRALEIALAINASIAAHRERAGL